MIARIDLNSDPSPDPRAERVFRGVKYQTCKVETLTDYKTRRNVDQVIRADVARIDGIKVTRHVIYVGVDFSGRAAGLLQDRDQPHARELVSTVMTGYNWGHWTGR